jgi:hypothetical protein
VLDGSKVEFPVDINARNKKGQTALFRWIKRSVDGLSGAHARKVAFELIKHGADPRIPDNNGDTVFHLSPTEAMELIILGGRFHININARNNRGETALHKAVKKKSYERVKFLLELGVDYNISDCNGETAEDIELHKYPRANTKKIMALSRWREEHALAIAMATHPRLGDGSWLSTIEPGLIKIISEMSRKSV